jgi:hypothetical protein
VPARNAVSAALQAYAGRGVFRGYRAAPGPRGRIAYQFHWLTRWPTRAIFDPRSRALSFPALLPGVGGTPGLPGDLKAIVAARSHRNLPAHKRVDARRARLTTTVRHGDLSLSVTIRGANHEYAVKAALGLINDLFLRLHESWPEYLVERFGMSTE